MTIQQAAAISKVNNLPIRRASWPADKWFWVWLGGHWFSYPGGKPHTALATDYSSADLLADDWTTVPAPLASCPVTPAEPGGGGPPLPGLPGWPDVPVPDFPTTPGVPTPGGGGPTLPPPNPGTGLTVTFEGIETVDFAALAGPGVAHWELRGSDLSEPRTCMPSGTGVWVANFTAGKFLLNDGVTVDRKGRWRVTVTRHAASPKPVFDVRMDGVGDFGWVWGQLEMKERGQSMDNLNPSGNIFGGTATVG